MTFTSSPALPPLHGSPHRRHRSLPHCLHHASHRSHRCILYSFPSRIRGSCRNLDSVQQLSSRKRQRHGSSSSSDLQFNQFDHPDTGRDSRKDTPGSQHSANSIARRQGENEPDGDEEGEDEEGEDYATQASIVDKVFTDADKAAAEEEENEPDRKAGRQEGSLKWTGPELRALIISMGAHTVFEPSMSVDEKSQAWLNMVDDLNKWNKKHPRKGGRFPVRTVDACDNKWRKCLYKAIAKGESASQIASGPKEDEDTIMAACQSLKDQWEQQVRDEAVKREAKKKAKNPDQAKAIDARAKATEALAALRKSNSKATSKDGSSGSGSGSSSSSSSSGTGTGTSTSGSGSTGSGTGSGSKDGTGAGGKSGGGGGGGGKGSGGGGSGSSSSKSGNGSGGGGRKTAEEEEDDSALGDDEKGKSARRLRSRRSDASSAELTAAVAAMSSQQTEAAGKTREQHQQQHEETLRQAERARELQRQQHRDNLVREDRRLDLEERALQMRGSEEGRVARLEQQVEQLGARISDTGDTTKALFDYIKEKLK